MTDIVEWYNVVVPNKSETIQILMEDATGNSIFSGTAVTNRYYYTRNMIVTFHSYGAFEVVVKLPDNVNLGSATMTFQINYERHQHTIDIQEVSNG